MGRERINDFGTKLRYSLGQQQEFDKNLLMRHIPKCVSVEKTDEETDKTGIDYIATLAGGAKVLIDAKTRERGCSRYWKDKRPELAIETWSVCRYESGRLVSRSKPGWTFNESTGVDYILYTFPRDDYDGYFFIPFQLLRAAAISNYFDWTKRYRLLRQANKGYDSQAMFVPADVVIDAVERQMIGEQAKWTQTPA